MSGKVNYKRWGLTMALIKCSECGKEISDKCVQCIHCGYPLAEMQNHNLTINQTKNVNNTVAQEEIKESEATQMPKDTAQTVLKQDYTKEIQNETLIGLRKVYKDDLAKTFISLMVLIFGGFLLKYSWNEFDSELGFIKVVCIIIVIMSFMFFIGFGFCALNDSEKIVNAKEDILAFKEKERDEVNTIISQSLKQIKNDTTPKCPTCGSTNIRKISATKKLGGALGFGIFSKTVRSQFECLNCKYKW